MFAIERSHAADREAVSLMNVRHRQTWTDDSGQRRYIHRLHQGLIPADLLHQRRVRVHDHIRAHSGGFVSRDPVAPRIDRPDINLAHQMSTNTSARNPPVSRTTQSW